VVVDAGQDDALLVLLRLDLADFRELDLERLTPRLWPEGPVLCRAAWRLGRFTLELLEQPCVAVAVLARRGPVFPLGHGRVGDAERDGDVADGRRVDEITAVNVAALVGELSAAGRSRETIRKTVTVLSMVLDHARRLTESGPRPRPRAAAARGAGRDPASDRRPRRRRLPAARARLPAAAARGRRDRDACRRARAVRWGDFDEPRGRWRVSRTVAKTGYGRWGSVPPLVDGAVLELCPRDDRHTDRRVFENFSADRLRMAISRACSTAGVPAFSPHDLRHRRISLLHLGGVPWATIGLAVGQRDVATTANTYSHVLTDETELDNANLLN
jgi:integrase